MNPIMGRDVVISSSAVAKRREQTGGEFEIRKVTREDLSASLSMFESEATPEKALRFIRILIEKDPGKMSVITDFALDGFACILNPRTPDRILGSIFLFSKNMMLRLYAGVMLRKRGWNVNMPMDDENIEQVYGMLMNEVRDGALAFNLQFADDFESK